MKKMDECKNEACLAGYYPQYGLAPHSHDLSSGSFIGSTRIKERSEWPKNFKEDPESPGCGVYVCPDCGVQ
jgi:hypothetical protein